MNSTVATIVDLFHLMTALEVNVLFVENELFIWMAYPIRNEGVNSMKKGGMKMENEKKSEELEIAEALDQIECAFCGQTYDKDGNCPNCVDEDEEDDTDED